MGVDPSGQVLAAFTELRRKLPAEIPSIIDEQHLSAYRIQHLSKQLKVSLQRSIDYCESPQRIIKLVISYTYGTTLNARCWGCDSDQKSLQNYGMQ
jgi:hypothetical protein